MDTTPISIPLMSLLLGFAPGLLVVLVMRVWSLDAWSAIYANLRMLLQLLLIGYVLTFVFEAEDPLIIVAVVVLMMALSSWIALRPLESKGMSRYLAALTAIGACGLAMLVLVTQMILELRSWFEPRVVVPLAGMIFANAMNTVSLAAERFEAEFARDQKFPEARSTALDAALIPQLNALFAVGLVSLPGMMTGQILSGVDPLIAARYQIMVMCMIFGSAGLAAITYLQLQARSVAIGPYHSDGRQSDLGTTKRPS
jgi:putative ABC transport system permease protein